MREDNFQNLSRMISKLTSNIQISFPKFNYPRVYLPTIDPTIGQQILKINESMVGISKLLDNYRKQHEALERLTRAIQSSPWYQATNEPEFSQFADEYGWCFDLMPFMVHPLYLQYKQGLNGGLGSIWDTFDDPEFLKDVLDECRSSFLVTERISYVEKGIEHHSKGDYHSAVCLLLPQIDGLIWDIGTLVGLVENIPLSQNKLDASGNVVLDKNNRPIRWGSGDLSKEIWSISGASTTTFGQKFKDDIYSNAFRHAVLHGRNMHLCTKANSSLLILSLMIVSAQASEAEYQAIHQ